MPSYSGINRAALFSNSDFRIFGKTTSKPFRRMGVALTYGNQEVSELVDKAKTMASLIEVN